MKNEIYLFSITLLLGIFLLLGNQLVKAKIGESVQDVPVIEIWHN